LLIKSVFTVDLEKLLTNKQKIDPYDDMDDYKIDSLLGVYAQQIEVDPEAAATVMGILGALGV